jgi:hypothetical protein
VAVVDQPHLSLEAAVEEGQDVPTAQREHGVDATGEQLVGHQVTGQRGPSPVARPTSLPVPGDPCPAKSSNRSVVAKGSCKEGDRPQPPPRTGRIGHLPD